MPDAIKMTLDQTEALNILNSKHNVFLTGAAGTGKSFVLRSYIESQNEKIPVLASTGAAAVLVGGRTFHRFFGLMTMKYGIERTVKIALNKEGVSARLRECNTIVIDEISMISSAAFLAADLIAQEARGNSSSFGGRQPPLCPYFL